MVVNAKNLSKVDPTRTTMLRNRFASQMTKRFTALRAVIYKSVVNNKVFVANAPVTPLRKGAFIFKTDPQKIDAFMAWLHEQESRGVLEIETRTGLARVIETVPWTNLYIRSAYQKGIYQARSLAVKAGAKVPLFSEKDGLLSLAFNQPFHASRVALLYQRTFSELKGITAAMDQQISRVLATGMAEGRSPRQVARELASRVDNIGIARAKVLARTEIIRAHHSATIQEYRSLGLTGLTVKAEWLGTGDGRMCDVCGSMEGKVFTLDQAEGLLPAHPCCRCCIIPFVE